MSKVTDDSPLDPFLGDPADPAAALDDLEESDGIDAPLTPTEREDVLADIEGEGPDGRLRRSMRYGSAAASLPGTQPPHPDDLPDGDIVVDTLTPVPTP